MNKGVSRQQYDDDAEPRRSRQATAVALWPAALFGGGDWIAHFKRWPETCTIPVMILLVSEKAERNTMRQRGWDKKAGTPEEKRQQEWL